MDAQGLSTESSTSRSPQIGPPSISTPAHGQLTLMGFPLILRCYHLFEVDAIFSSKDKEKLRLR